MSTGPIVTAIVAALVAISAIAMIIDARRKRRAAARAQTHSNVKPQPLYDEQARIREGGIGIGEGAGGAGR